MVLIQEDNGIKVWDHILILFEEEAGDPYEGEDEWETQLIIKLAEKVGLKYPEFVRYLDEEDTVKNNFIKAWDAKILENIWHEKLKLARKWVQEEKYTEAKEIFAYVVKNIPKLATADVHLEHITLSRIINSEHLEDDFKSASAQTKDGESIRRYLIYQMQSGISDKILFPIFRNEGYKIRLCRKLIDYGEEKELKEGETAPLRAFDNSLPPEALKYLHKILDKEFFKEHTYNAATGSSDTCGFFSYLHKLDGNHPMDRLFHLVQQSMIPYFPSVTKAKLCEWWTHRRPHSAYHQLHFDSDNEGINGLRNPVLTVVLFLSDGAGGPTLVTNQEKDSVHKTYHTAHGWICYPKENRMIAFPNYLHGVLPGKGNVSSEIKRHTLMLSFWEDVPKRDWDGPGATRAVSECPLPWTQRALDASTDIVHILKQKEGWALTEVPPLVVPKIWENIDGSPLKEEASNVMAHQAFQF